MHNSNNMHIEDINIIKKKYKIIGFLDDLSEQKNFLNYPILGKLKDLKYKPNEIYIVNSIGSSIKARYKTTNYFLKKNYKFENNNQSFNCSKKRY